MSDPLFSPPSLSALSSSTGSLTDSSCSSASLESSTSSASTRLSPLPETDEVDVGDVDMDSSWFNSFKEAGVGADDTELMLDLRDLGFTELEGDEAGMAEAGRTGDGEVCGGVDRVGTEKFEEAERLGGVEAEGGEAEGCQPVTIGEFFGFGEKEGLPADACRVDEKEISSMEATADGGQVVVGNRESREREESEAEGMSVREKGPSSRGLPGRGEMSVIVGEKESVYGSEAEEKRKGEAKRRRSEAEEKGRSEAEERDWAERNWAERRRLGELEVFRKNECVVGGSRLGERVAEGSHLGEGEGGYFAQRERTGCVAEKPPNQPHARATDLVEFLGLGSSSDTEEDDLCVKGLGFEKPLAIVADGRRIVEVEASSGRLGECESEGLTEEMGELRREMLDPGMLDVEWRQKTLVLNGEEIANSIYHISKGYHLHLPPEGSFIHDPPEGHVGVYLKHLEFGLRFPLADEIVQIVGRMGLSLGQLTPQSVRVIVAYVWVCRFFRVPPTVDLFRSLHHIAPVSGVGYWMVVSEPGKLVVWPKKYSTKDWRGRFFFLSYPEGEWAVLRTPGLRPRRRLETDEELLSSRPLAAKKVELKLKKDRRAYKHFDFKGGLPFKWLPPAEVILMIVTCILLA